MFCGGSEAKPVVKIYYWQGFQGRGYSLRLACAAMGLEWEEVLLDKPRSEVRAGMVPYFAALEGNGTVFAPPGIEVGGKMYCQVSTCLAVITALADNMPADMADRLKGMEICATMADLLSEMFKKMSNPDARAEFFTKNDKGTMARIDRFFTYLNNNAKEGKTFLLADKPMGCDMFMYTIIKILEASGCDEKMAQLRKDFGNVFRVRDTIDKLEGIQKYYASEMFKKNGGAMGMPIKEKKEA